MDFLYFYSLRGRPYVVVVVVDSRRRLVGEPSVLTWYFACGLWGAGTNSESGHIRLEATGPRCSSGELITLNVFYEECL